MCDAGNNWVDAAGATATDNTRDCECATNFFKSTGGTPTCGANCAANEYKNAANKTCVACANATSDGTGDATSCVCSANFENVGGTCTACNDADATAVAGEICKCSPAGEVLDWTDSSGTCKACPSGSRDDTTHACPCTAPL